MTMRLRQENKEYSTVVVCFRLEQYTCRGVSLFLTLFSSESKVVRCDYLIILIIYLLFYFINNVSFILENSYKYKWKPILVAVGDG